MSKFTAAKRRRIPRMILCMALLATALSCAMHEEWLHVSHSIIDTLILCHLWNEII